jgi:hypothetical protein
MIVDKEKATKGLGIEGEESWSKEADPEKKQECKAEKNMSRREISSRSELYKRYSIKCFE